MPETVEATQEHTEEQASEPKAEKPSRPSMIAIPPDPLESPESPESPETEGSDTSDPGKEAEVEQDETGQAESVDPDKRNPGKQIQEINQELGNLRRQMAAQTDSITRQVTELVEKMSKAPAKPEPTSTTNGAAKAASGPNIEISLEDALAGLEGDDDELVSPGQIKAAMPKIAQAIAQQIIGQIGSQQKPPTREELLEQLKQEAAGIIDQTWQKREQARLEQQAATEEWKSSFPDKYSDLHKAGVTADDYLKEYNAGWGDIDPKALPKEQAQAYAKSINERTREVMLIRAENRRLSEEAKKLKSRPQPASGTHSTAGTQTVSPSASTRRGGTMAKTKPSMITL